MVTKSQNLSIRQISGVIPAMNTQISNVGGGKYLIRLFALLLAFAVPASVLLAEDGDHDNDRDHGRFVDPIVGSWIVHVTVTSPEGVPPFDNLTAFFADGTTLSSEPVEGTGYGVWKRVALRTYSSKFLTIVPPNFGNVPAGSIDTLIGGPILLNAQGDELEGPIPRIPDRSKWKGNCSV
jgi:hypothetical protein